MYEWFWSTMIVKYPEISGIDDGDLYGYFGYTSVPYTYTLNQLIYELFDGSPNMDGVVRYFSYREDLDYDSYIKLLNDYQYGWLSKAWNTVAGFLSGSKYPADHYFFYCDGEEDNAFIGENGADDAYDNSSALVNKAEDVIEAVSTFFSTELSKYILGFIMILLLVVVLAPILPKIFETIVEFFKWILKGILYILTAPFRLIGKLFKGRKR